MPLPEAPLNSPSFSKDKNLLMANALRLLTVDSVEKASSGHPGMPLGMADVATVLWSEFLEFDPQDAGWLGRDRFILSAGHGSMLLYGLLHVTTFPHMSTAQLGRFRQLKSLTPGHPEVHVPGVEVTTGPLGQGVAHAVGIALAERLLVNELSDRWQDPTLADAQAAHWTYVILGDGCLMEGVTQEALSLAGHLKLGRLILLWDDNQITIDGATSLATSEDHCARLQACGWHTQAVDGHDPEAIRNALVAARAQTTRPSFIACRTTIGWGAPTKAGTAAIHGAPLGPQEASLTRKALGGEGLAPFQIPPEAATLWREVGERAHLRAQERKNRLSPQHTQDLARRREKPLPPGWTTSLREKMGPLLENSPPLATRQWSQKVLDCLAAEIPALVGGSADLTTSNNTQGKGMVPITPPTFSGRYVHFGVREHAMAGVLNGLALSGYYIPYGGTFLVFSDYMRPGIRLAALMNLPTIFVMTHDSIGLGEDGPTHQPIEHLASLRAMPNLNVMRPGDGVEVMECWEIALDSAQPTSTQKPSPRTPSLLALSRQSVTGFRTPPHATSENLSRKGAYSVHEAGGPHRVTLLATGSEVGLACTVRDMLEEKGIGCRVVSMPSWFLFDKQPQAYQDHILSRGEKILRVSLEAGTSFGWSRYVGDGGITLGVTSFGESAPADVLYDHFHLKAPQIVSTVLERLSPQTIVQRGQGVFQKLVFASDHRGFALKERLRTAMEKQGWLCEDVGTFSGTDPVDYPDFVIKAAHLMGDNPTWAGVLICGSGVGMSIAANRFHGIRAALCHTPLLAQQSRHHNNANVLVLGAGSLDGETVQDCLDVFLTTPFDAGRHLQRLEKLETYSGKTSEEKGSKKD